MEKALKILLVYVEAFFATLIIGTLCYSFFISVSTFVYGSQVKIFSLESLTKSFFYIIYCIIFLICPFIAYYRIRHVGGVLQTVFFVLVCVINWGAFLPLSIKLENFYASKNTKIEKVSNELSPGYFRSYDDNVVYFLDDNTDSNNVIFIDKSEEGKVTLTDKKYFYEKRLIRNAAPYKEVQIKENFQHKGISLFVDLDTLIQEGKKASSKGFTFFLGFMSIGFALCSLYGISNFMKWRAMNACFDILSTIAILTINTYVIRGYYGNLVFKILRLGFINWMIEYVDQPVLVFLNIVTGLIFIVAGTVKFIIRKAKKA